MTNVEPPVYSDSKTYNLQFAMCRPRQPFLYKPSLILIKTGKSNGILHTQLQMKTLHNTNKTK